MALPGASKGHTAVAAAAKRKGDQDARCKTQALQRHCAIRGQRAGEEPRKTTAGTGATIRSCARLAGCVRRAGVAGAGGASASVKWRLECAHGEPMAGDALSHVRLAPQRLCVNVFGPHLDTTTIAAAHPVSRRLSPDYPAVSFAESARTSHGPGAPFRRR
jgi:hypothetical protein